MKIKINPLDLQSIDDAIAKLSETKKAVNILPREIIQSLVDKGVEHAKQLAPEVAHHISGYVDENGKGYIVAEGNAAVFLEFGTGIKGAQNPYPDAEVMSNVETGYDGYMSGSHIFKTKDGRIGWVYYNESAGRFVFTEGVGARAYMYDTAKYIREIAPEEAKVILANVER